MTMHAFAFSLMLLVLLASTVLAVPSGKHRRPRRLGKKGSSGGGRGGKKGGKKDSGKVVIANRVSGTISVIDEETNMVTNTVSLPATTNPPEPMYVNYSERGNVVFVGDRSNDQVVVFDADDFSVVDTIPAGAGVFHMWNDDLNRFLWVNNDIDKTTTVIDIPTRSVINTVPMPANLVPDGCKPHDVILDPPGDFAFVTYVGCASGDVVSKFSTTTFAEIASVSPTGGDPHVSLTSFNGFLYVPTQASSEVMIIDRATFSVANVIAVDNAHGAGMAPDGATFYTTNISGGGTGGLIAIDTGTNTVIGVTDTPHAVPHNIVVTNNGKLFVTHSGATADKVSIFSVSNAQPIPVLIGDVTVGLNPFGLAYVP